MSRALPATWSATGVTKGIVMITMGAIPVGLAIYILWNRRWPTTNAELLWRAGIPLTAAGAATMPWQWWWSGLPEVAVAPGIQCAALSWRQRQRPARPPELVPRARRPIQDRTVNRCSVRLACSAWLTSRLTFHP
jgi:hypothetical protein